MNEDKTTTVEPYPETLMLFDRQDDEAIIARLEGQVVESYVYSYPQPNGTVYGIGTNGAEACKRELALTGEVIEEDDISIESENVDEARFRAKASRWAVRPDGQRVRLDSAIGMKRQPKTMIRKSGTEEANPHWYEQGGSKAMRNAILKLTPREIQLRMIAKYKGTKHEKKVEMPPATADALTNQAHASFKDKDEKDELVRRLRARWRELELTVTQVKAILQAKNLSLGLMQEKTPWTTVDLAVIQELLAESGA